MNKFNKEFNLSKDDILSRIYSQPNANVFLASFSQFIGKFKDDPFIRSLLIEGFKLFIQNHVCCFKDHQNVPVNFVGSVAYHFKDVLIEAADDMGIILNKVLQKPIDGLVDYVISYEITE